MLYDKPISFHHLSSSKLLGCAWDAGSSWEAKILMQIPSFCISLNQYSQECWIPSTSHSFISRQCGSIHDRYVCNRYRLVGIGLRVIFLTDPYTSSFPPCFIRYVRHHTTAFAIANVCCVRMAPTISIAYFVNVLIQHTYGPFAN